MLLNYFNLKILDFIINIMSDNVDVDANVSETKNENEV